MNWGEDNVRREKGVGLERGWASVTTGGRGG